MKQSILFLLFNFCSSLLFAQTLSDFIVVDQFGYRTISEKIAVIRDPQTGFDAAQSFTPGGTYALVDVSSGQQVFMAAPVVWNGGVEDPSSGDKAWWFDFSSYVSAGSYYVLDITNNVRSFEFDIRDDIYDDVLKHAVRSFYYQRVGHEKVAPFADAGWIDGASHLGALQDKNCRKYDDPNNASIEKDVSGGWYDAGDLNKYTNWTANYVYEMLLAYHESPSSWSDDYNLPESGNSIPDIIDEAKWGMDHLLRLQNTDGSVISIVDEDHASPPSAATGPSLYGAVNTSAALSTAGAFAFGAKVFGDLGMTAYATTLQQAAELSYNWAVANPSVVWRNNDAAYNSSGIGSGQQETDDYGRLVYKIRAAMHLFEVTGITSYRDFVDQEYSNVHLIAWTFAYPFERHEQDVLLYYTTLQNATTSVVNDIKSKYETAIEKNNNFNTFDSEVDPYLAHIDAYTWGSNSNKARKGVILYDVLTYNIGTTRMADAVRAGERYIHYIHGLNPENRTYLTNMYNMGGDRCANQIFHTWFSDGSPLWDEAGVSTYGPAPGFLAGGPNPSYDWDGCCPSGCGGTVNNDKCTSMDLSAVRGQPDQKSYLDFNNTWPLNSWEVTENSCGYQVSYIRLLSKYVDRTGVVTSTNKDQEMNELQVYPNPVSSILNLQTPYHISLRRVVITTLQGVEVIVLDKVSNEMSIDVSGLKKGGYLLKAEGATETLSKTITIQ